MTTEAPDSALVTSAVDPEIAAAIRIHDRLVPVKEALGISDLSDQEVSLFAMVAQRSQLDPFAKQIYAVKRSGKVSYQTGIDGYRSIAARTHDYAGSEEATFEACDCGQAPDGHPSVARVVVRRIHRSGRMIEQTGIARWHELYPGAGDAGRMWQKMPFNQIAKCAEANGLRKLFPTVLADIYITDEMEQAGPPENAKLVEAASQPKAADRLAARRAAVEAQQGEIVDSVGAPIETTAEPDLFEDSDATTDPQDEAASAPEPSTERAVANGAASSAPAGYELFKTRLALADPRPTHQQIVDLAYKQTKLPDLSLKNPRDWPLLESAWVRLANALDLPQLPAAE